MLPTPRTALIPQKDSVRNFFSKENPIKPNVILRWFPLILCSSVISTFVDAVRELLKAGVSEGFVVRLFIMILLAYVLRLWVTTRELRQQIETRPKEMVDLEIENEVLTRIVDRLDAKTIAKETGFIVDKKEKDDQVDS